MREKTTDTLAEDLLSIQTSRQINNCGCVNMEHSDVSSAAASVSKEGTPYPALGKEQPGIPPWREGDHAAGTRLRRIPLYPPAPAAPARAAAQRARARARAAMSARWWRQPLDHLRCNAAQPTWEQRYLLDDTYWGKKRAMHNGCRGPILFYSGNEGPIEAFYESNGMDLCAAND
eukprot:6209700-Pleurochrysis_carterae.AAC.6